MHAHFRGTCGSGVHVTPDYSDGMTVAADHPGVDELFALLAYGDLKKDVELLKQDSAALHGRDTMHEDQMRETVKLMQDQYARLDAKLDRLIERRQK